MAFDQPTRNRLQKFVSDTRTLLSEEFTRQLQHEYGLDPATGDAAELDSLRHLDDSRRETARLLRETLEHYQASAPSGTLADMMERIVREQAFTVLNRLCALRMAEARGLLRESVGSGYTSKGFQLYARLAGTALGETGDTYRCYLFSLFDEFAVDLPVLFDRYAPMGRLFPREAALLAVLEKMNAPDIAALWTEDETIGWIYQYFNSVEERRQMRKDSQAPRNSRELAVRNQFFTPRYVVEFLTDNTLGRIWYEMMQGNTSLKDTCRYLVRRPNEIFLQTGEDAPSQFSGNVCHCEESATKQSPDTREIASQSLAMTTPSRENITDGMGLPVYIPFRPLKDPRDIRMLDPACGSMHFGLYAFDLFERIYEEAWELEEMEPNNEHVIARSLRRSNPVPGASSQSQRDGFAKPRHDTFRPLHDLYASKDEFLRDVPRLIIEHNIHGVDIDPRAAQIAGLSLWLRAQRSWQRQGVKPAERPEIRKSNIVCAEPMPGEKAMLQEFADSLQPKVLGQLVDRIFDKMQLAGEAGSLLKIEEEIEEAVTHAREEFNKEILRRRQAEQELFPDQFGPKQTSLFDFADLPDKTTFWNTAIQKILDALQAYAEQAESADASRRRLFTDDAAKGFAFIELCRKRFDVVLMNPPFGESSKASKKYLETRFPDTKNDLYAAFIESGVRRIFPSSRVGAITSRTGFFLSSFTKWRESILLKACQPVVVADLGYGVLDAMVETAAYVLEKQF